MTDKTPTPTPDTKKANAAPASNSASDAKQGTEGTRTVNSPDVNLKSTPGMDSDASGTTTTGTQAGPGTESNASGTPNKNENPLGAGQDGQDRLGETQIGQQKTAASVADGDQISPTNHPDAFNKPINGDLGYDSRPPEGNVGANEINALKDKLERILAAAPESTPNAHVLFGIGGIPFTLGDLRLMMGRRTS